MDNPEHPRQRSDRRARADGQARSLQAVHRRGREALWRRNGEQQGGDPDARRSVCPHQQDACATSSNIVDRADAALRSIVDIYFSSNKAIAELRAEINGGKLDLLRDFSSAAREELSTLKY